MSLFGIFLSCIAIHYIVSLYFYVSSFLNTLLTTSSPYFPLPLVFRQVAPWLQVSILLDIFDNIIAQLAVFLFVDQSFLFSVLVMVFAIDLSHHHDGLHHSVTSLYFQIIISEHLTSINFLQPDDIRSP